MIQLINSLYFRWIIITSLTLCLHYPSCLAQSTEGSTSQVTIGPELQIYPTGLLPGIRIEKQISEKSSLNFRLAAQIIDHRDLGVQDDETGSGWGASIGIRNFFSTYNQGWSMAGRLDLWRNSIDWSNTENGNTVSGNTKITVLQPTVLLEYAFRKKNILISPSLGLGYEWNVTTDGEPTGEGAILLLGCTVGFSL